MACSDDKLSDLNVSKVTDIVSAENRCRLCVEYLGIALHEYKAIEADAQFIHHDTLFECIRRWRNMTEAKGYNAKDELVKILSSIQKERGWFSQQDMAFLQGCVY